MKTWTRVTFSERCGACNAILSAGMAMQVWKLEKVKRRIIRCEACVGPAPPALPALIIKNPKYAKGFEPLKSAADILRQEWQAFKD